MLYTLFEEVNVLFYLKGFYMLYTPMGLLLKNSKRKNIDSFNALTSHCYLLNKKVDDLFAKNGYSEKYFTIRRKAISLENKADRLSRVIHIQKMTSEAVKGQEKINARYYSLTEKLIPR